MKIDLSKIIGNRNVAILGVDVESTGLLVPMNAPLDAQPHMIEYAGIHFDGNGRIVGKNVTLINPPVQVPGYIQKMTGIQEWQVRNYKPFKHYASSIKKDIERADLFVAHNAGFDYNMICVEFCRLGINVKWPPVFCTVENSMHYMGRRLTNAELLAVTTGTVGNKDHRAERDIKETMASFFILNGVESDVLKY